MGQTADSEAHWPHSDSAKRRICCPVFKECKKKTVDYTQDEMTPQIVSSRYLYITC